MRGIELKHIGVRSFMLKGLTARWGIDGNRPPMPPALRTALVAWYNTEIQRATNFDVVESYAEDFTANKWTAHPEHAEFTKTAKGIHLTNVPTMGFFLDTGVRKYGAEMVVRVSGLQPGVMRLKYRYGSGDDTVQLTQDGIYTLPAGIPGAGIDGFNGFAATVAFSECNITIEQLPTSKLTDLSGNGHHLHLYGYTGTPTNGINADGWLQSAAVGYGVSYGQPKLTDYTLCMTRAHAMGNTGALASKSLAFKQGAFIFEMNDILLSNAVFSGGTGASVTFAPTGFVYQTKDSYNGTPITAGTAGDADILMVGGLRPGNVQPYTGSYKSFVLFNRTLTTEELAYVRQWMA